MNRIAQTLGKGLPRRRLEAQRGQVIVIYAPLLVVMVIVALVMISLVQLRHAIFVAHDGVQMAAIDAARLDTRQSTLRPPSYYGRQAEITLAAMDDGDTQARLMESIEMNLMSIAPLLDNTTPAEVAKSAEYKVVSPAGGACETSPFQPAGRAPFGAPAAPGDCYYDPFVAVRVVVPLKFLWGGTTVNYEVIVVGSVTDNDFEQGPPTPIPTSTRMPQMTVPAPVTPAGGGRP